MFFFETLVGSKAFAMFWHYTKWFPSFFFLNRSISNLVKVVVVKPFVAIEQR